MRLSRLDDELDRTAETVGTMVRAELVGGTDLRAAVSEVAGEFVAPGRWWAVFDERGSPVNSTWVGSAGTVVQTLPSTTAAAATTEEASGRWRSVVRSYPAHRFYVEVRESLAPADHELDALRRALLVVIPLTLLVAGLLGFWVARRAIRPISEMAAQVQRIGGRRTGLELTVPGSNDELVVLARSFNALLSKLEATMAAERQFMADASHDLRTPVSILRTASQVVLQRETRSEEEYRECLEVIDAQTRRLSKMVDDMFTLARADTDGLSLSPARFYFDELVEECVTGAALLAQERQVGVRFEGPKEVEFEGDEKLLRQMLMNLLENAIGHSPESGQVRVRLDASPSELVVRVVDGGNGIPAADRERIFERFARLDPARSRPGAGLGLPIARSIVEAHEGALCLEASDPGGSTFAARLPRRG
jgi:signal transduction histidine kinase